MGSRTVSLRLLQVLRSWSYLPDLGAEVREQFLDVPGVEFDLTLCAKGPEFDRDHGIVHIAACLLLQRDPVWAVAQRKTSPPP